MRNPRRIAGMTPKGSMTFYNIYNVNGVRYATGPKDKALFAYVPDEDRWQCVALPYEFSLEGIKYKRTKVRRYAERRLRENYA